MYEDGLIYKYMSTTCDHDIGIVLALHKLGSIILNRNYTCK